jgi:hypothetical protein
MTLFLWSLLSLAFAQDTCAPLAEIPESLQVAWVSRAGKQIGANAHVEVVRVGDLRALIQKNGKDKQRLLRSLGIIGGNGGNNAAKRPWKVTIFDVQRDWLCRPLDDATPGEADKGVVACESKQQKPVWGHGAGFTGCGYIEDTQTQERSLDVFRIRWSDAASWGFCVLPLDRFLDGA